jgi:hypothetical protein
MKSLLADIQTAEQMQLNEHTRHLFIMAMMNLDESMIGLLLKEDCKFLGHLNNWQLLHWFRSQFDKLNSKAFHSKFTFGISLDYYPGADMLEFSYSPISEDCKSVLDFNRESNDEATFKSEKAFKIKLVLLYENGKIADIRMPKKFACVEKTKIFQKEN